MITLPQILKASVKREASDTHLVAGSPPVLRVFGNLLRVKSDPLKPSEIQEICYSVLTEEQIIEFEQTQCLEFSFGLKKIARFRGSLFFQKNVISAVFRRIPIGVPNINQLGLPPQVEDVINYPHGLVLLAGPTGSGKSTTLAGLVDKYNQEKRGHIITVEDPIEFIHKHKNCIINQREVGSDVISYSEAIKNIKRQNPDFVLIGELTDEASIRSTLKIAETGPLVLSSVQSGTTINSIQNIVEEFSENFQDNIRIKISNVLRSVICQHLVKSRDGGLIVACEFLTVTNDVKNLIRNNQYDQIYQIMQTEQDQSGMMTLNQSLLNLILRRKVDPSEAFNVSPDPDELDQLLTKVGV